MAELFCFPKDDPEQVRRECEDLRWIITHDVAGYCTWLREMERPAVEKLSSLPFQWDEDCFTAVLSHGLYNAFQMGTITLEHLIRLAYDPNLLGQLTDRVFFEGADEHWTFDLPESKTVKEMLDDFKGELEKLAHIPTSEQQVELPIIHNSDLQSEAQQTFIRDRNRCFVRFDVPIVSTATLTLKWKGKVWGKLLIEPKSNGYEVLARTGVFLGTELPRELPIRMAAKSEMSPPLSNAPISIEALPDGLVVYL